MTRYRVKDFNIECERTGSRLLGRENEYVYRIYWNGKRFDKAFATKRQAQEFISKFVKKVNALIEEYEKKEGAQT